MPSSRLMIRRSIQSVGSPKESSTSPGRRSFLSIGGQSGGAVGAMAHRPLRARFNPGPRVRGSQAGPGAPRVAPYVSEDTRVSMPDTLARLRAALAGRYTIERELGRGGMATVYLARDLKHHRRVAIKVLKPELASALGPERFLREIEISARLTHPHILPLHDSGAAEGLLYY